MTVIHAEASERKAWSGKYSTSIRRATTPPNALLAEAVMHVFADDSVSAIFSGENQLF